MTDGSGTTTWTNDTAGRTASETQARSHRTVNYSYDARGRLQSVSMRTAGSSLLASYSSTCDAVGQRTGETALDHQRSFSHNARRQLIESTTTANGVQTAMPQYAYDGIGNRLSSAVNDSAGAQASAYTPNAVNPYTAITGALADTPAYDANGNTTSVAGETLSYDRENRLVGISDATHQSVFVIPKTAKVGRTPTPLEKPPESVRVLPDEMRGRLRNGPCLSSHLGAHFRPRSFQSDLMFWLLARDALGSVLIREIRVIRGKNGRRSEDATGRNLNADDADQAARGTFSSTSLLWGAIRRGQTLHFGTILKTNLHEIQKSS